MKTALGLGALLALALSGAAACDPELPGRACSIDDDCFRDEICQGTSCVSGERSAGEADANVDAGPTEDDAGSDAENG